MSAASRKRLSEETDRTQPKRTTQAKLDRWMTVSPSPITRTRSQNKKSVEENIKISPQSSQENVAAESKASNPRVLFPAASSSTPKISSSQERLSSSLQVTRLFSQSSMEFSFSQESRDSFLSESSQDLNTTHFDINQISQDPKRQKQYLVHHLTAQRRLLDQRLEVRPGSLVVLPGTNREVEPLSSVNCQDIWFSLDKEWREQSDGYNKGWLEATSLVMKFITPTTYLPAAACHKILNEAVINQESHLVRGEALNALRHCLKTHPPGPNNRRMSLVYLEMMSHKTPHVGNWEFSVTEPWEVLSNLLESCVTEKQDDHGDPLDVSGPAMALEFLVLVCHYDLDNYLEESLNQNRLRSDYQPLLVRIFCPSDSACFSRRMQQLCKFYSRAVAGAVPALETLRALLGLTAQILQLKERTDNSNSHKEDIASFLAHEFHRLELSENSLWAELYLLEPSWLSALVSREILSLAANKKIQRVSLRPLLTSFVYSNNIIKTDEVGSDSAPTSEREVLGTKKDSDSNRNPATVKQQVKSVTPGVTNKSKPVNVHKRNPHGETPVHTAAKTGNIARLRQCLDTPGVDINCVDNNGYTPLSEAVNKNKLEAVRLLLEYRPQTEDVKTNEGRVDILIKNNNDQSNAFHEAVEMERIEMVKLILETIQREESNVSSGFPSLFELLNAENGDGETVMTMPTTEEMKQVLNQFSSVRKEKDLSEFRIKEVKVNLVKLPKEAVGLSRNHLVIKNYGPLIELAITKYIGSNCLDSIYRTFRTVKLQDLLGAVNAEDSGEEREGKVQFAGGFRKLQFGARPRFDIYRTEKTKVQDLRDFENILKKDFSPDSSISRLLMNITN